MYLFLVTLGLHCCACISLVAAHRLLLAVASFVAEHGLWGSWVSVVVAIERRISNCGAQI